MTTIADIMRFTIQRFGINYDGPFYLIISSNNSKGDPPAYLIRTENNEAVLRRLENDNKHGAIIPIEEHSDHIENFSEVFLYANHREIERVPINDYLEYIFSAIK
jgi:hypothetical protein